MFWERINRLFILSLCLTRYFLRGKADTLQKNPKNFLIIPAGKLGDVVCNTPVFWAIRQKYPNAKIFAFGGRLNKEILDNAGLFDYYIASRNFFADLLKIRKAKIDFACVTGTSFLDLALFYLAGIPLISALIVNSENCIQETRPYKILARYVVQKKFISTKYMPLQYLSLLEPVGIHSSDTSKHLAFTDDARKKALKFYRDNNVDIKKDFVVGVTPSAGNEIKLWETKRFAEVVNYLFKKYDAKIIIFGSENEKNKGKEMIQHISKDTFFVDSTGIFDIDGLKAAVSMLDLFVSVDTAPIYIAEAFGVATVDIVGPVDENIQPPIGRFHKIVKLETRKKPALNGLNTRNYDYYEARRQIDGITVEMVTNKIDELIPLSKKLNELSWCLHKTVD